LITFYLVSFILNHFLYSIKNEKASIIVMQTNVASPQPTFLVNCISCTYLVVHIPRHQLKMILSYIRVHLLEFCNEIILTWLPLKQISPLSFGPSGIPVIVSTTFAQTPGSRTRTLPVLVIKKLVIAWYNEKPFVAKLHVFVLARFRMLRIQQRANHIRSTCFSQPIGLHEFNVRKFHG